MSYKESNLSSDFCKYLRIKKPKELQHTFALELKCKHGKEKLHLIRDFRDQQIPSLILSSTKQLYHKISDLSVGLKPFDAFSLFKVDAYVAVCWYTPRKPKRLLFIPIERIQELLKNNQITLTPEEAEEISKYIFNI